MLYAALVSDDLSHPAPPAGPADGHPLGDPTARCLLRRAQGAFQKSPEGFAGFRASVACETPRGLVNGQVTVAPPDRVDVICDDADLRTCLRDMLWAVTVDRTPRFFDEGDGRFPISFGDGHDNALGRPVNVLARFGQCHTGSTAALESARSSASRAACAWWDDLRGVHARDARAHPANTDDDVYVGSGDRRAAERRVRPRQPSPNRARLAAVCSPDQRTSARDAGRDLARRARTALNPSGASRPLVDSPYRALHWPGLTRDPP